MSIIKILPENLVNQIAAGEVIERPASVVKELVENSLDAGATSILVEIKDSGKTLIKVSDNGKGMSKDDLQLAIQRHATSKISGEADLWKIQTLGFRGEALASISSVSKMTLKSKQEQEVSGAKLEINGGEILTLQEIGMNNGTIIEVYNLFFNTPARQKYLKQEATELGHISNLITTIALAHPEIAFKLIHNEKIVSDLPRSTDLISRIADIFGKNTADATLDIFYGGQEFQIDGFIGKPVLSRSSSQHQYFFVNGRGIQHHLLANTIKNAYHSMLMENKKPIFFINIKIDPALIDVNVHPRKLEIRFEDQETLLRVVYGAVKKALEQATLIPKGFTESRNYMSDNFPSEKMGNFKSATTSNYSYNGGGEKPVQESLDFSRYIIEARDQDDIQKLEEKPVLRAITQVSNSYIVAENEEGLILIDQHAAHERVRYEQLMNQFENQEKSVQPLLVPQTLELTTQELLLVEQNMEVFENLGFEIEHFGGQTFVVRAVPSCLSSEAIDEIIKGVLDDVINSKNPSNLQGKTEEILTYMSCRSAIKFGQKLGLSEMQSLIMQMENLKRPYTCPHGRPTMISLTLSELERMFGRK